MGRMWRRKRRAGDPGQDRPEPDDRELDYLDLVPRKVVEAEAGPDGSPTGPDGRVVLLVPRYRDALWGRLLQPRLGPAKRWVRVPLEARGTALWLAIDGRRSVRDLVAIVAASAPGDTTDLPRRTCLYVQALADNGFLAVERPAGPAETPPGASGSA